MAKGSILKNELSNLKIGKDESEFLETNSYDCRKI